MHLNCPPNALFAEIYIDAEAAVRWSSTCDVDACGPPLTNGGDLIGCATYGLSTRASDPTIGKNINDLIRSGFIISVDNPVGLYLEKLAQQVSRSLVVTVPPPSVGKKRLTTSYCPT
jgi:hypothetical protein